MANTGNVLAGTGESNNGIGVTAWTSPGNVTADDATDTTCNAAASSQYLVARNFNFSSIPAGAIIGGILVRVEASEHSGGTEALLARLQDSSGALVGTQKNASNEGNISGTTKAVYTYGSTSDVWGATLTDTIVKNANFGVRFWFTTAHDVRVDFVTMAVEYTTLSPISGDGAVSLSALTLVATAKVRVLGMASYSLPSFTVAGNNAPPGPITGLASLALPKLTIAAAGVVRVLGSAGVVLPAMIVVGVGAVHIFGLGALILPMLVALGAGPATGGGGTGQPFWLALRRRVGRR